MKLGYAIGFQRRALLIKHSAINSDDELVLKAGIFDTLGYKTYSDADGLAAILQRNLAWQWRAESQWTWRDKGKGTGIALTSAGRGGTMTSCSARCSSQCSFSSARARPPARSSASSI